jgi:hypothetical protein
VRRALLTMAAAGAFVLAVVGPSLGLQRERVATWGEAADDAGVLTAVVAGLVACVALGTIVGPGLRAVKQTRERDSGRLLYAAILLAIAAGAGWIVLTRLDAR